MNHVLLPPKVPGSLTFISIGQLGRFKVEGVGVRMLNTHCASPLQGIRLLPLSVREKCAAMVR